MHLTELETSKKLKSLGADQDKAFIWVMDIASQHYYIVPNLDIDVDSRTEIATAFTLDEILDILPDAIENDLNASYPFEICLGRDENNCRLYYCEYALKIDISNTNPAEAAAELLIWCIENKHVDLDGGHK